MNQNNIYELMTEVRTGIMNVDDTIAKKQSAIYSPNQDTWEVLSQISKNQAKLCSMIGDLTAQIESGVAPLNTEDISEDDAIRMYTQHILDDLGVPCSLSGYRYICDAVAYVIRNGDKVRLSMKEVLHAVAEKNETTIGSVERGIRWASESRIHECPAEIKQKYFGASMQKGHPPVMHLIYTLAKIFKDGGR